MTPANEFYEDNRPQLVMYKNAERYLRDVLQNRFDPKKLPPITMRAKQLAEVNADIGRLNLDNTSIKNETAKAEKIQHTVRDIQRDERQEPTRRKVRGVER